MAQYPFYYPCWFPFAILLYQFLLLTWNPSFDVVLSCPPWSQVARKLTSPSPFLSLSKFPSPQGIPSLIVRPIKTTSRSRLHIVRNRNYVLSVEWYSMSKNPTLNLNIRCATVGKFLTIYYDTIYEHPGEIVPCALCRSRERWKSSRARPGPVWPQLPCPPPPPRPAHLFS